MSLQSMQGCHGRIDDEVGGLALRYESLLGHDVYDPRTYTHFVLAFHSEST